MRARASPPSPPRLVSRRRIIYARFGSKRALLGELVARLFCGADPRPVPEQAGPPGRAQAASASSCVSSQPTSRSGSTVPRRSSRSSARRGPSRSSWSCSNSGSTASASRNLRVVVESLLSNGPLRLPEKEALETVWALTSPEPSTSSSFASVAGVARATERGSRTASPLSDCRPARFVVGLRVNGGSVGMLRWRISWGAPRSANPRMPVGQRGGSVKPDWRMVTVVVLECLRLLGLRRFRCRQPWVR